MLLLSQRPCYDKLIACDTSPDQDDHKASTKLVNIKGNDNTFMTTRGHSHSQIKIILNRICYCEKIINVMKVMV